jgi:hypothetical protein
MGTVACVVFTVQVNFGNFFWKNPQKILKCRWKPYKTSSGIIVDRLVLCKIDWGTSWNIDGHCSMCSFYGTSKFCNFYWKKPQKILKCRWKPYKTSSGITVDRSVLCKIDWGTSWNIDGHCSLCSFYGTSIFRQLLLKKTSKNTKMSLKTIQNVIWYNCRSVSLMWNWLGNIMKHRWAL